jgi:hypothetical protein
MSVALRINEVHVWYRNRARLRRLKQSAWPAFGGERLWRVSKVTQSVRGCHQKFGKAGALRCGADWGEGGKLGQEKAADKLNRIRPPAAKTKYVRPFSRRVSTRWPPEKKRSAFRQSPGKRNRLQAERLGKYHSGSVPLHVSDASFHTFSGEISPTIPRSVRLIRYAPETLARNEASEKAAPTGA